jgi:hypothetical protein
MYPFRRTLGKPAEAKPGDLIGFAGSHWISDLICLGTYGIPRWSISHVGIMGEAKDGGLLLFESTSLIDGLPCAIAGVPFHGTQAHELVARRDNYRGKVWHYPLYRPLYEYERQRLTEFLMATIHVPYDEMGAFRSGGVGLSWIESLLHEQSLTSIFCSEWCAAAHAYIGVHATDNVSRWNPTRLIRHERRREILLKPRRLK